MTVQPREITNFTRSDYELQEFALFCIAVAGKSSDMQAKKLDIFLAPMFICPLRESSCFKQLATSWMF